MKLSKTIEQACCVLAIIAEHHGSPVTNLELNDRMNVSQSYLMKLTRKLVVAGIVSSSHGAKGGFVLAIPMRSITLAAVVKAIEGVSPFFTPTGTITKAFPAQEYIASNGVKLLQASFEQAEHEWFMRLDQITMEHLISNAKELS